MGKGNKYRELLSLIQQSMEGTTNLTLEEIENRAYEYYSDDEITPSQYDHIQRELE